MSVPCYCVGPWFDLDPEDQPIREFREHRTSDRGCLFRDDPQLRAQASEPPKPEPMADWSESERAYAFGDR